MDIKDFQTFIDKTNSKVEGLSSTSIADINHLIENIKELYKDFKEGGKSLIKEGGVLKIGIVGQVKAGKSSFLNSLFFDGQNVLPKASTPMTAGLTILEYADCNVFEVEYYTQPEWDEFKRQYDAYKTIEQEVRSNKENEGAPESFILKEIKSRTSDVMQSAYELVTRCGAMAKSKIGKGSEQVEYSSLSDLKKTLNEYVGANGEYTSVVKMLNLRMNDPRLQGIKIVDTPGVNDPIVSRENRTKEFLHSCHGVFFLSYSSRFFDSVDVSFMNTRIGNQGVGTILMLASKYDDVLQDQGNKFKDDIEGADESSRNSLEKRFMTQKNELIHPNIDIRFDTTSGISFALATKNKSEWDEMEMHVDKRMHELFPSAFSTDSDSIETYLLLANFEQIREEYLDKMFKDNKDKIIERKLAEYFKGNINGISDKVDELKEYIKDKIKQLDTVELKDIYAQQAQQDKLFTSLKGEFSTFLHRFQDSLQTAKDSIYESIELPRLYTLPLETVEVKVTYKGFLWGHNTDDFTAKMIDAQSLKEQALSLIKNYASEWSTQWQEFFTKAKHEMFDSFCKAITEFSKNVTDLNFSDRYYRQLMNQLLSEIERHGVLKIQDVQDKYSMDIASLCDSQSIRFSERSYDCKEDGVQSRLNNESNKLIESNQRILNNKLESYNREIGRKVNDSIDPIVKSLEALKSDVDSKLKTAGKEYLDGLKEQIANKEATKKEIINIQEVIEPLNQIMKEFV